MSRSLTVKYFHMMSNSSASTAPDPPPHLNGDATCKWRQIWSRLDHDRFDARRDWDALTQYCEAWADIREADREIKRLGQIGKTNGGTAVPPRDSINGGGFYKQLAAAMERYDRAGGQLSLLLRAPPSSLWSDFLSILESLPQDLADQDKQNNSRKPSRPRIWTLQRVWTAVQMSCGNMAAAARLLSETYGVTCSPATISRLAKKYRQLRDVIEESELALLEFCQHEVITSALDGDDRARRFVLSHYHPDYMSDGDRHRHSF
jgi:hypothetical protein